MGVKYHLNKAPTCPARWSTAEFPVAPPTDVAPRAALMAVLRGFQQALDPPEGLPWLLPILSSQWFAINWDFLSAIWSMICEIDYCICRFHRMLFLHQKSHFLEPFPNNVFKTLWYHQSIEIIILITVFYWYQNYIIIIIIINFHDQEPERFRIGHTKIFFRAGVLGYMEDVSLSSFIIYI